MFQVKSMANYDFLRTRYDIIRGAYEKIGVVAKGEPLSGQALNEAIDLLNEIVLDWQNEHIFLWTRAEKTFTVTTKTFAIEAGGITPLLWVDRAKIRKTSEPTAEPTPLKIISFEKYTDIEDKDISTGLPEFLSLGPPPTDPSYGLLAYLYPIPDVSYDIITYGVRKLSDWDGAGTQFDIPQRFHKALKYQLAVELGEDYKIPAQELLKYEAKALKFLTQAKQVDCDRDADEGVEGSY